MQPHQYENSCWSDKSSATVKREQMYLTLKIYDKFVKDGMGFCVEMLIVSVSNKACHPGGHGRDFYPGAHSLRQVCAIHLKIGLL